MRARKMITALLVMAGLFQAVSCGKPAKTSTDSDSAVVLDKNSNGFYREWDPTEDEVKHDTFALVDPNSPTGESTGGRKDANGDWTAQYIYTTKRSTVLCEVDNIGVPAGYYKFVCNTYVGNVELSFNGYTHDILAEMRVQESGTGKAVAFRSLLMDEFEKGYQFEDKALYFKAEKPMSVDVFICAKNRIQNTVHKLSVVSVDEDEYLENYITDYKTFLEEPERDRDIEYSDNATYVLRLWDYISPLTDTRAAYDIATMAVALQGLANRTGQRIFVSYVENMAGVSNFYKGNIDDYWLKELTKKGNELSGRNIVTVHSLGTLFRLFKEAFKG
ncbi:MAG: hypothetical protein IJU84_02625, partial [Clostridia bacterium]|nr:hypothetical protein [Clostridia bacterium]